MFHQSWKLKGTEGMIDSAMSIGVSGPDDLFASSKCPAWPPHACVVDSACRFMCMLLVERWGTGWAICLTIWVCRESAQSALGKVNMSETHRHTGKHRAKIILLDHTVWWIPWVCSETGCRAGSGTEKPPNSIAALKLLIFICKWNQLTSEYKVHCIISFGMGRNVQICHLLTLLIFNTFENWPSIHPTGQKIDSFHLCPSSCYWYNRFVIVFVKIVNFSASWLWLRYVIIKKLVLTQII